MQHMYFDTSNLNAPYDNVPLRGLGQYGGGVFGRGSGASGNLGSLGALTASGKSVDAGAEGKALQQTMGAFLKALGQGYVGLDADGKLGPASCGAAKWIWENHPDAGGVTEAARRALSLCAEISHIGWTAPQKASGVTSTPPKTDTPKTDTPGPKYTYSSAGGGSTWWIVGGLVVAAGAIGAALYFKK